MRFILELVGYLAKKLTVFVKSGNQIISHWNKDDD